MSEDQSTGKHVARVRSDERVRDEKSIAEKFPDRGEFPGNEVKEDPDAKEAPNTAHPH